MAWGRSTEGWTCRGTGDRPSNQPSSRRVGLCLFSRCFCFRSPSFPLASFSIHSAVLPSHTTHLSLHTPLFPRPSFLASFLPSRHLFSPLFVPLCVSLPYSAASSLSPSPEYRASENEKEIMRASARAKGVRCTRRERSKRIQRTAG